MASQSKHFQLNTKSENSLQSSQKPTPGHFPQPQKGMKLKISNDHQDHLPNYPLTYITHSLSLNTWHKTFVEWLTRVSIIVSLNMAALPQKNPASAGTIRDKPRLFGN
jgi:hypothetical protein